MISELLLILSLFQQISCVEQMTCFPESPMEVFSLYKYQAGVPNAVILGLFLGIINAAIYMKTKQVTILAITGIYTTAAVATTWANETVIQPAYNGIMWIIALSIATGVLMMILKVLRE